MMPFVSQGDLMNALFLARRHDVNTQWNSRSFSSIQKLNLSSKGNLRHVEQLVNSLNNTKEQIQNIHH